MWKVLHDNGKSLCFVGRSGLTKQCVDLLGQERPCGSISFEDLQSQSSVYLDTHQFMCVSGDVSFKQAVTKWLTAHGVDFFSLIGRNNAMHPRLCVGRGTFINDYNDLLGESRIGDHVIISSFCQLGRQVNVGDYCHISSWCYLNNCTIGTGTALGIRSSVIGEIDGDPLEVAEWSNFMANSMITKPVKEAGTYYGNRRVSHHTRQQHRIV